MKFWGGSGDVGKWIGRGSRWRTRRWGERLGPAGPGYETVLRNGLERCVPYPTERIIRASRGCLRASSDEVELTKGSRSICESAVSREKNAAQSLGERDIAGAVGGYVASKFPYAVQ